MADQTESSNPNNIEKFRLKGTALILIVIAMSDNGLSFSQVVDETGLARNTVRRRMDILEECGWITIAPKINDKGNAVKAYKLAGEVGEIQQELNTVGKKLF